MDKTLWRKSLEKHPQLAISLRTVLTGLRILLYKNNRKTNVAMLHAGRCGSSVTAQLIRQHPDIHWGGEIFESMSAEYYLMPNRWRAYRRIKDSMYKKGSVCYGFETKFLPEQHLRPELANLCIEDYLDLLNKLNYTHFILLRRNNYLRQALSTLIGYKTGIWVSKTSKTEHTKVSIDPNNFISYGKKMSLVDFFRSLDDAYEKFNVLLKDKRVLVLSYEKDIENDARIAYGKICDFLELEPCPVSIALKKQNPMPATSLIENYSEIRAYLANTPYSWMTDE